MSQIIRRDFQPNSVTVIDDALGIIEYVATTPTVDSYGEVVDPKGADTSRLEKNGPLLADHNYAVDSVLGRIIDCRLVGKQLIMRVQFALNVPSNPQPRKIYEMVKAGYIPACYIGFIPTQISYPTDVDWKNVCEDLGMGDLENSVRCVYRGFQLLELSVVAIGANQDCIAKAYAAGIVEDADLLRVPA